MGLGETAGTAFGSWLGHKRAIKDAEGNRERQLNFVQGLDWQPQYTQKLMSGQYQKTQSPLARSYLESILTGNNPDTTFSGSPNAAAVKDWQQGSQNRMYGTPEVRQSESQFYASNNPYHASTPDEAVGSTAPTDGATPSSANPVGGRKVGSSDDLYSARYPLLAKAGIDTAMHDDLVKQGILKDGAFQGGIDDGKNGGTQWAQGMADAYRAGDMKKAKAYGLISNQLGFGGRQ